MTIFVLTIYPNFNPGNSIDATDFAGSTYDGAWTFQTNLPAFRGHGYSCQCGV